MLLLRCLLRLAEVVGRSCWRAVNAALLPTRVICWLDFAASHLLIMSSFDLDVMQQEAWEGFVSGKNVALFGRAGCGKST